MSETYDTDNYMIVWDRREPGAAAVEVGPWPDVTKWSKPYQSSTGCCDAPFKAMDEKTKAQALLNLAADLMFCGVPPTEVLNEFSKIRTWREMGVLLPIGRVSRAFISGRTDWNPHDE